MQITIETQRQMYEAVVQGDAAAVRRIIRAAPDLLQRSWTGDPQVPGPGYLHLAATKGQQAVCEALLELGLAINTPEPGAHSVALDNAATAGHLELVRWFLDHGASADGLATTVAAPLVGAAIEGRLEIARTLLDAGAEVNREHLRLPQTALDFAVAFRVKASGQDAVAELLRERGGLQLYTVQHDWQGVPGQCYIEHLERAVCSYVSPLAAASRKRPRGGSFAVHKLRLAKKYDYQLLFSVSLAPVEQELMLCLPSSWPLNRLSLTEHQYRWPLEMLLRLSEALHDGQALAPGDLLDADHPLLQGVPGAGVVRQWVLVQHQVFEDEREGDSRIPRTLLLAPVTTKKLARPGAAAAQLAEKKSRASWKKLAVPLPSEAD